MHEAATYYNNANSITFQPDTPRYTSLPIPRVNLVLGPDGQLNSGTSHTIFDSALVVPYFRVIEDESTSPKKVQLQVKYVTYMNNHISTETSWMKVPRINGVTL